MSFLAAAGAPTGIPRRILAERPASRRARFLRFPVSAAYPGGLFFSLGLLAATFLLAPLLSAAVDGNPFGSAGSTALLRALSCALYVLAVPMLLRGLLFRLAPQRLPLVPTLSVSLLLLLQLLPLLLVVGHGEPPYGVPFFIPGVFGCEERTVVIHLIFSGVALIAGLAVTDPEVVSAIRAYLAPPLHHVLPARSFRATSHAAYPPRAASRIAHPPPASPMPPPASPMPTPLPAPSAPAAQS